MHVSEIWRYPVKSMMGSTVGSADITDLGIVGDRTWAARDQVRGGIRGAKKIGSLMTLAAAYSDGPAGVVTITMPDGSTTTTSSDDRDAVISAALDRDVTLQALRPASDLEHYRRGDPDSDDMMEELNAIFGREEGEPLPDLSIFPPEIVEFESPPGTYYDAFPLMIMTTSALRSLSDALPESVVDVRRFRPSLVIDTGEEPGHPEFDWVGRRIRIGPVELEVPAACPRCVMVTREIDGTVPADRAVLRHIVSELDQNVGVYATTIRPGSVKVGDEVELI